MKHCASLQSIKYIIRHFIRLPLPTASKTHLRNHTVCGVCFAYISLKPRIFWKASASV